MDQNYYESLKAGLEDAVAFIRGDKSRGKIVENFPLKTRTEGISTIQMVKSVEK